MHYIFKIIQNPSTSESEVQPGIWSTIITMTCIQNPTKYLFTKRFSEALIWKTFCERITLYCSDSSNFRLACKFTRQQLERSFASLNANTFELVGRAQQC